MRWQRQNTMWWIGIDNHGTNDTISANFQYFLLFEIRYYLLSGFEMNIILQVLQVGDLQGWSLKYDPMGLIKLGIGTVHLSEAGKRNKQYKHESMEQYKEIWFVNASFEVWRGVSPRAGFAPYFPLDLNFSHDWLHTTMGSLGLLEGDIRWWDITKGRKLNWCLLNVDDNLCRWHPSNLGQSLSTLCFLFTGCCLNWKICFSCWIMAYA